MLRYKRPEPVTVGCRIRVDDGATFQIYPGLPSEQSRLAGCTGRVLKVEDSGRSLRIRLEMSSEDGSWIEHSVSHRFVEILTNRYTMLRSSKGGSS